MSDPCRGIPSRFGPGSGPSPGTLAAPGEERTQHDEVGPGGHGLDEVARITDPAIGDERHALGPAHRSDRLDRAELRHPDAGDDAGGADRSGPDSDLHRGGSRGDQVARAFGGDDVAATTAVEELTAKSSMTERTRSVWARGRINEDGIGPGLDDPAGRGRNSPPHPDGGADAEAALLILGGIEETIALLDVLRGDESGESGRPCR